MFLAEPLTDADLLSPESVVSTPQEGLWSDSRWSHPPHFHFVKLSASGTPRTVFTMRPAGSGSLSTFLFLFLNLVVLSTYALPLHGTSAGTGLGRLKRHFRTSQPARRTETTASGSIHAHLHQRRKQAPIVASSRRSDGPMSHHVHLIGRAYLPANMTDVRHVILARRHRHKDYQNYNQDDEGEDDQSSTGRDGNGKGYDDGSWNEDKHDGQENEEDTDSYSKKGKSKYKAASSGDGDSNDVPTADETNSADDSGQVDNADSGDTTEDSVPATKGKTVSKSSGDDAADEDDTTSGSSNGDSTDNDGVEEDDSVANVSGIKNKSVKSSKEDDSDAEEPDDDKESDSTSTKSARSASTGDCATLQKIYNAMGGSSWTQTKGWTNDSDNKCCTAYGVSCNADGQVTALDLGSNGLNGTLSPAIFELKSLNRL